MFRRAFLAAFSLVFTALLSAQGDSVICNDKFNIREGVYLDWASFRTQKAIGREAIESKVDKTQLDFLNQVMKEPRFIWNGDGGRQETETSKIWGFYQNSYLFLNYQGEFFRVPNFGSISYMIAIVEVINPNGGYYTPGYGITNTSYRTNEVRSFLVNFYDGRLRPYSQSEAEKLISRDTELYKEFMALKKKQRKEQVSRYIRKYNERNPVYFLK